MGIGRRHFLKLFGSTLATAAASGGAAAFADDLYVNRKLGFAFRKPPGWEFMGAGEMQEQQAGQISNIDDPEFLAAMAKDMPVVCARKSRLARNEDEFTPGVQFYYIEPESRVWQLFCATMDKLVDQLDRLVDKLEAQTNPAAAKTRRQPRHWSPPVRDLQDDAEGFAEFVKQFTVLDEPRPRIISGCAAGEYTASFLFEHRGLGKPVNVRKRSLRVVQKRPFSLQRPASFLIRLYDAPQNGPDDTEDYDPLIESIRIM